MPRLLILGFCQRAIIDREDGSVSMISLLGGIKVPVNRDNPLPENAGFPIKWGIVAHWARVPEDEGKSYEQKIDVIAPNGELRISVPVDIYLNDKMHTAIVNGDGFPIAQFGEYIIRLSLREKDSDQEWQKVQDYPVDVTHIVQDE